MSKDKISSLKTKLKQFGFTEQFTKDNYNIISHLLTDFIKIQKENISLKEELNIIKKKNIFLLDSDKIKNKFAEQIKILINDKKKLALEIKELKEKLEEKKKDKNLMVLNEEKNKNYIDFIKIENKNLIEDEKKYKKKITELLNQISSIKEENIKYINLSQKNNELSEEIKQLKEKIQTLENNINELNKEKEQTQKILKEKNKELRDGLNNNDLLRKDLDIMNSKLKELVEENNNIKQINKNLLEEKNDLNQKLLILNKEYEELRTNSGNIDHENKLILAENNNLKYMSLVNEKKIYMANCEIKEMDKTIKYLKKNLEQIKLTNTNCNLLNNKKAFCCQCGFMVNESNNNDYDINKLIEDNKALYKVNKDLKHKLDEIFKNLNSNKSNEDVN